MSFEEIKKLADDQPVTKKSFKGAKANATPAAKKKTATKKKPAIKKSAPKAK